MPRSGRSLLGDDLSLEPADPRQMFILTLPELLHVSAIANTQSCRNKNLLGSHAVEFRDSQALSVTQQSRAEERGL